MIVKIATSDSEIKAAQELRIEVFVEEQGIPKNMELDEKDERSTHALVIEDDIVIGTGRLTPNDDQSGTLSRIAIKKEARGRGLGGKIMDTLEQYARDNGFKSLDLTPHAYLEKFYGDLGYHTIEPNAGEVGGHPLIKMAKNL
ncbi:MAG: GNAT family N-acetyltransferase [bacterium]|nr:GNAT family N-acetyltransferase [bacterium]